MNNMIIGKRKELKLLHDLKQKDGLAFVAVFLTMITTFCLVRNDHAMALVQNDLTMDILFRD